MGDRLKDAVKYSKIDLETAEQFKFHAEFGL